MAMAVLAACWQEEGGSGVMDSLAAADRPHGVPGWPPDFVGAFFMDPPSFNPAPAQDRTSHLWRHDIFGPPARVSGNSRLGPGIALSCPENPVLDVRKCQQDIFLSFPDTKGHPFSMP
jgi:hypothetical protein